MIKRTLFFSNTVCLSLKNKQLVVKYPQTEDESTVPVEDIGFVVIDNSQIMITVPLINALTENNAAVVFCNDKHLPFSMNLPLDTNTIQSQLFSNQINAKLPVKKKCWKQVIESKIANQGSLLEKYGKKADKLFESARNVKTGDSTNREGYAAKLYWESLMGKDWYRDRFGIWPNNYLNYGYAILRAAVARAIVGSGLLPTLGINHHNKYNAYCLADDIMEPYRPFIDDEVMEYINCCDEEEVTQEFKKKVLQVLTRDVKIGKVKRPLMVALTMTTASLAKVFAEEETNLVLPVFI